MTSAQSRTTAKGPLMERLPPETFEIPLAEIRRGYRSAIYFNRAKEIARRHPQEDSAGVLMQVFQKNEGILCGMDEALGILKTCSGHWRNDELAQMTFDSYMSVKLLLRQLALSPNKDERYERAHQLMLLEEELNGMWVPGWDLLEVEACYDGTEIVPWEPVMHIRGPYSAFAHLESVYLGVLARRTLVASNTARVVDAANGKPVLFFADRFDHWANQGGDGYAAYVGGATGFASDAMGAWWGESGMGTMPHALIAFFDGDTIAACRAFHEIYPDVPLIPLVDFNNDCADTAEMCYHEFGDALWGVRLDTSENMVDASIYGASHAYGTLWTPQHQMGDFKPTGVNPQLVHNVRSMLDGAGGKDVKVVASGGFNPEKINTFEEMGVPVDAYAVGESLLLGSNSFTADVVEPTGKAGRWHRESSFMERVH
jgi:nicotinate phosphoribosyltransferase